MPFLVLRKTARYFSDAVKPYPLPSVRQPRQSIDCTHGSLSHLSGVSGSRGPLAGSFACLPRLDHILPVPDLLIVTRSPLPIDAKKHLLGCLQFVRVPFSPMRRELALESMFEHGLAVSPELLTCCLQHRHPVVKFGEESFELGDDAPLFGCGWQEEYLIANVLVLHRRITHSVLHSRKSIHEIAGDSLVEEKIGNDTLRGPQHRESG